ncbi:pre-rRNA processing protein [Mycoemilia scoparia]|uniref:Pre-rRNA processing protein n=1 Tax=Mycoemilia scoparia TaxID=417184 RepID=A0A9W8A4B3_9FUNG|nr:pre-rRNA processing protein [Mycoemilia scoparia]
MAKDKLLTKAPERKRKRMRDAVTSSAGNSGRKGNARRAAGRGTARGLDGNGGGDDDDDNTDDSGNEVVGIGSIYDMDLTRNSDSEEDKDEYSDEEGADAFLETPAEKRLRLAKEYITRVKGDIKEIDADGFDAAKVDQDLIAERFVNDSLEKSGKIHKIIANYCTASIKNKDMRLFKNGHHLSITCVAATPDLKYLYSGSKDGSIVKWDFQSGKRLKTFKGQKKGTKDVSLGHCDQVLCLAVSSDGSYLASGGKDRRIHIWSVKDDAHLTTFFQHKDSITGLAFRKGHNQLYSCSLDRMLKIWNIDEMAYMETLFGHLDGVLGISTMQREQAVTVGSRDRNLRLWKVVDGVSHKFIGGSRTDSEKILKGESAPDPDDLGLDGDSDMDSEQEEAKAEHQGNNEDDDATANLVKPWDKNLRRSMAKKLRKSGFKFTEGSIDTVAMLDEDTFVTGGDSGAISLWHKSRKKPVFIQHLGHGVDDQNQVLSARWITAIATLPLSDLFVTGSWDGFIRVWRFCRDKTHSFEIVNKIEAPGFVNSLQVCEGVQKSPNTVSPITEIHVVAGIGQEPRMGRWSRIKEARNRILVATIALKKP